MRLHQDRSRRTGVLIGVALLHGLVLWWLALTRSETFVASDPPMILTLFSSPPAGGGGKPAEGREQAPSAPSVVHLPPARDIRLETFQAPVVPALTQERLVGRAPESVASVASSPSETASEPAASSASGMGIQGGGLAGQGAGSGAGTGAGSGSGAGASSGLRWIRHLTTAEKREVYPNLAARRGVHGEAVILCRINRDTTVSRCRPISEHPTGQGFGRAAVRASAYMRIQPRVLNGVVQDGARERITVPFVWTQSVAPEESAPR